MFCVNNKKICIPQPQFYYVKVGFHGIYIAWTYFPDGVLAVLDGRFIKLGK